VTIVVIAVGRPDRGRFGDLFDEYAGRVRRFGASFEARYVPDVKPGGRFSDAHVRQREAAALREAIPSRSKVVALTPDGQAMKTETFARRLESWSVPAAAFVVGGPLGLDPAFVESANATISLSALTLPHELARVVLAEQIYRAVTILRGVPYHK
jgi:23S rRNA (pseudouridine1915-N3)-methyltransferase